MSEVVKEWIKENLLEQLKEAAATMENEKLWLLGADSLDAIESHTENIKLLCEYMDYLNTELYKIMKA